MIEKFASHSWFGRNPLGIIALFISLIYGMSALLLGQTVGLLSLTDQRILTLFIVIFPFVILGVFSWLVSCHHKKLYGPGDYKTDDAFQKTWNEVLPETIGKKLADEIKNEQPSSTSNAKPAPVADLKSQVTEAYVAEGLVFQELQSEFNGPILREVAFGSGAVADGIIEPLLGSPIVVEIKRLRSGIELERRVQDGCYQLMKNHDYLTRKHNKEYRLVLAIVVDNPILKEKAFTAASRFTTAHNFPIECRVMVLPDLMKKYNFSAA